MTLEVGNIVEGTVVNITNFGAFIDLNGKTGLVHISEVADTYVKDIKEFIKEGDKVKVKVLGIDANGKISLSIKQGVAIIPKRTTRPADVEWSGQDRKKSGGSNSFEDIMSKFMKESEEIMSDYKKKQEVRTKNRRS
ncbi:RNA-binding protein S1 [Proteiniclasticum sp. BAD-10]|uniref:RNA-binding protein S1 n=1 Tax=Proteiniclasticum sediminis TaxID=2804028 RepID=A0A941CPK9_9CLOT|nr:S1 domain-containing RNA-binding protein [Proteiniclasticum sediminis]MBR0576397.1 RNA-binding protein S1 [Proteiniclasticum sediminis]